MVLTKGKLAILTVISLLEILLFGGLQYGWASLLYIIKQEGVYKELCIATNINTTETHKNATDQCFAQDERLNLLFSIGLAVFNVMTLICGQLYTRFITATRMIRTGSIFVLVAGLVCFGVTSPGIPWLVLPGIICVGTGGVSLVISNMQVAVLLPRGSSVYIGLLNGCFDSSVVIQMAVKALFENGIDLPYVYAAVAILCVCISGLCTLLHPCHKPEDTVGIKNDSNTKYTEGHTNSANMKEIKSSEALPPKTKATTNKDIQSDVAVSSVSDDATPVSVRTIVCSRLYIFQVLWLSIMLLRFYYFIGSINRLLVLTLENDKQVSYFTDVMTYTMLGGMVPSLIAGHVLEVQNKWFTGTMKTVIPLTMTSCLAIILSSLSFGTSKTILYPEYVVLTFFRSFIFSVNMSFVVISFPQRFMSLLFGLVSCVSGILTLTQYLLFTWTVQYEDAMKHVNIFLLCLSVLSLLHPLLIFMNRKSSRVEDMKIKTSDISNCHCLLSPKDAYEYKWNGTTNLKGGTGHNIPNDNLVEILVHRLKVKLQAQGANVTYASARKAAMTLQVQDEIKENMMVQCGSKPKGTSRTATSVTSDINVITNELLTEEVFNYIPGRQFENFKNFNDLFAKVKIMELHKWITKQKERLSYETI